MYSLFKPGIQIWFLLLITLLSALPQQTFSINTDTDPEPAGLNAETDLKFGVSTIYSPDSFAAWGKIRNSSSFSIRGQFWYSQINYKNLGARLGAEFILTHRLNYPINGADGPEDTRIGIGLIPLNVLLPIAESKAIHPFAIFSAGGIFLNDKLPQGDGASFNYLLNIGGGIEIPFFRDTGLQIGYSIQHMSNANTGEQNPGIDSHMFFISIQLP